MTVEDLDDVPYGPLPPDEGFPVRDFASGRREGRREGGRKGGNKNEETSIVPIPLPSPPVLPPSLLPSLPTCSGRRLRGAAP